MSEFTPEERAAAQTRLDAALPVEIRTAIAESEKRYAADPDAWLRDERAKCERIETELRSSSRSPIVSPIVDGQYADLQSVGTRSI
jgi:hypothetical protein